MSDFQTREELDAHIRELVDARVNELLDRLFRIRRVGLSANCDTQPGTHESEVRIDDARWLA